MKKRVTGIGGIFFRAKDPEALTKWYDEHLNISPMQTSPWGEDDEAPLFEWRDAETPERKCYTVFSIMGEDSTDMGEGGNPFMFNFRVEDMDAVLAALQSEGVEVVGEVRTYPYGRFVHIKDPEGNQIELWEPADGF